MKKYQIGKKIFIPFTDKLFNGIWRLGETHIAHHNENFLTKIKKFQELNKEDFQPIYYCYEHQGLEDGTHRSWAMRAKGHTGYETLIGRVCWKKIEKLNANLKELIDAHELKTKDVAWTNACKNKKWNVLSQLDFSHKTYLDVGSQSGFSAFMGWNSGAIEVVGVEKRKDISQIAQEMKAILKANEIEFYNADWLKFRDNLGQFDIVSCMGLMHYFEVAIYDSVLTDLCQRARETLILELRTWDDPKINHKILGTQTLITKTHLNQILTDNNFTVKTTVDISNKDPKIQGLRELWIMEKNK